MSLFSTTINDLYEQMCRLPAVTAHDAACLIEITMAMIQWNQLRQVDIAREAGLNRAHPQDKVLAAIFVTLSEEE